MLTIDYINGVLDSDNSSFHIIRNDTGKYEFEIHIVSNDPNMLYRIREFFDNGNITKFSNYVLKLTKFGNLKAFKMRNKTKKYKFRKFKYLYQKLILESNKPKTERQLTKIERRLKDFK